MAKILLVDDNTVERRHLAQLLIKAEMEVLEASNGREAMEVVKTQTPDAIVCDIHGSEKDGLDLVSSLRTEVPTVPVLVTAIFGSEELAVKALRAGASNYLPKRNITRDMLQVLDELLSVSQSQTQQAVFLGRMTAVENEFVIENSPDLVGHVVSHVESMMTQMKLFTESERVQVGVAVHEAVLNAIVHGNLEISSDLKDGDWNIYHSSISKRSQSDPYQNRHVTITVRATREPLLSVRVRDEGPGYDPHKLPDPTDVKNLELGCGRGMLLIRTFFDQVLHSKSGNEITMIKRGLPPDIRS